MVKADATQILLSVEDCKQKVVTDFFPRMRSWKTYMTNTDFVTSVLLDIRICQEMGCNFLFLLQLKNICIADERYMVESGETVI